MSVPTANPSRGPGISGSFGDVIATRVGRWPGVASVPHRLRRDPSLVDGVGFVLAGSEFGHVHDDGVVDVAVSPALRDQLLTDGLADRHRTTPGEPGVSYYVRSPADVPGAIRLCRLAYLRRLVTEPAAADLAPTVDPWAELDRLGASQPVRSVLRRESVSQPVRPVRGEL